MPIKSLAELQKVHYSINIGGIQLRISFDEYEDSDSSNPVRVYQYDQIICVNKLVFYNLNEGFQYFFIQWAFYRIQNDNICAKTADILALKDYLLKGYSKDELLKFYPTLQFKESGIDRIENIINNSINF